AILRPSRPMPKTSPYRILDHQQPTKLFDRDTVGPRPIRRRTRLQSFAASTRQLVRYPCGYTQSMGASVRFKTGILHNVVRDQQMEAYPGVLTGSASLAADRIAAGPR